MILVKCDDYCICKNAQVAETSSMNLIENVQGSDDKSSMTLPPVPLSMKIDETN